MIPGRDPSPPTSRWLGAAETAVITMATNTDDTPTTHLERAGEAIDRARTDIESDSGLESDLDRLREDLDALLDRLPADEDSDADDDESDDTPRIPTPGGLRAL